MKTLNYNELLSILSYNLDQNTLKNVILLLLQVPQHLEKARYLKN
jgi:hypothetical protein